TRGRPLGRLASAAVLPPLVLPGIGGTPTRDCAPGLAPVVGGTGLTCGGLTPNSGSSFLSPVLQPMAPVSKKENPSATKAARGKHKASLFGLCRFIELPRLPAGSDLQ